MADGGISRFAPQNKSTHERLSTSTIGLVALSDFRKRRAQVLEQEEREARSGPSTPSRSRAGSPDKEASGGPGSAEDKQREEERRLKRLKKKGGLLRRKQLLSFGDDDDDSSEASIGDKIKDVGAAAATSTTATTPTAATAATLEEDSPVVDNAPPRAKLKANAAVPVAPRAMTKAALLQEATEREALRREFLAVQEAVKESEIVIPFVFYDGTNIPGGVVRLRKGDFVWYFLDRSRKVGAELRSGRQAQSRRAWARIGVDDLLLVRDTIIIPHHYDFYFFTLNKNVGPSGRRLFDFSAEAPAAVEAQASDEVDGKAGDATSVVRLTAAKTAGMPMGDIKHLEGASDDPTWTKVVDRRWYERNKHIYPASTWQQFDPETDYTNQIRKDTGGNTFFFSN